MTKSRLDYDLAFPRNLGARGSPVRSVPRPRRERRATCAEDDGATSVPLPTGRAFASSVSPSPVRVWLSLPAALQLLPMLLPSGGAG